MTVRLCCAIITGVIVSLMLPGPRGRAAGDELPAKVPVQVRADKLDYDRTADVYRAEGHVRIEQDSIVIEADRVVLENRTGQAIAEGNVHLQQKDEVLRAEKLEINVNTRAGVIYDGDIFLTRDNYHMTGKKIEKRSDTEYHLEEGTFTTCDEEEWFLQAKEIDVDLDRYATGSGVSFRIGGLPVFYAPYFLFPVRRQTGLLIPEAGYGSDEGFLMKNAFFWAISDRQDATLTSDYRREHGHGTGLEYRYVNSRESSGQVNYTYFRNSPAWFEEHPDQLSSALHRAGLWEFKLRHYEEIAEDLSLRADISLVSDYFYYRELEKDLALRSQPYLDANVFYVERWDTAALYLAGQYSTDLTRKNDATIQKLPELRYSIFQERLFGPVYLGFDGSATNFSVREGYGVQRADFNPRLTLALSGGGASFTPRVGMRATYYDRSYEETTSSLIAEPTDMKYVYAGADLNLRLSRVFGSDEVRKGIGRIRHSIEPSLSYDFVPRVDTADIPQFDALDEVTRRNQVTASLINRVSAHVHEDGKSRTVDLMVLRVSQSYDLLEMRNEPADPTAPTHPRSSLEGEVVLRTPHLLTASASGIYDPYIDHWTSSQESLNLSSKGFTLDVSHRYLRDPETRFLIGGAGFKLFGWELYGRVWRDQVANETTQEEYRALYQAQCWGIGFSYITTPADTRYMLTLELKGMGAMKF